MQKQFKRILKTLAIAPYFLGCAFVSTSLSGVIELVSNDYKTADQIDSDALKFNADISNCTTNGDVCTRLKHNNGRPIYVYVSDEYSDIIKAMSFGLLLTVIPMVEGLAFRDLMVMLLQKCHPCMFLILLTQDIILKLSLVASLCLLF